MKNIELNLASCVVADNSLFNQYRGKLQPEFFADAAVNHLIKCFHNSVNLQITPAVVRDYFKSNIQLDLTPNLSQFTANLQQLMKQHQERLLQDTVMSFMAESMTKPQDLLAKEMIVKLSEIIDLTKLEADNVVDRNWLLGNIQDVYEHQSDYIKTGYAVIDNQTPIEVGSVVVLVGNTGTGKSTVAMNIYTRMLMLKQKGIYVSMEMTERSVAKRIYNIYAEKKLKKDNISATDLDKVYDGFANSDGHMIIVEPRLDINILKRHILAHKKAGYNFAIVDHLHRMKLRSGCQKHEGIAEIMREIRNISIENNFTIFVLAQGKSDNVKSITNNRLGFDGIAGSQEISWEANYIFMLHREAYFRAQKGMAAKVPDAMRWITEVNCVKARENEDTGESLLPSFCLSYRGGALRESTGDETIEYRLSLNS